MAEQFAMPAALELEATRRNGIPAVRRKMVHNTTTQNEYRPGELVYIPIDTGANGAFMDTSTTRLKMTVVTRNKNYFTDFINLPRSGWHAIIQEFGIEINNTLHELNRHYAECIELDMIKKGENRHPFQMTMENPYRVADGLAGKFEINFVKPSMVTLMGLPHNVRFPNLANTETPDIITQSWCLFSNQFTHQSYGTSKPVQLDDTSITNPKTAVLPPYHYSKFGGFHPSSMEVAQSFYDDRISQERTLSRQFQLAQNRTGIAAYDAADNINATNTTSIGSDIYLSGESTSSLTLANQRIIGGPSLDIGKFSKMYPPAAAEISVLEATFGQSVDSYSPGQWPAKQPTDLEKLKIAYEAQLRFVNADNVLSYYANTQNIPVGIPVYLASSTSGATEIWGDGIKVKEVVAPMSDTTLGQETIFHISLRVYSSLIGVLAKKWFPELVVPQGRMRIRLRLQEPNVLFQLGTDPCRRIPGTPRDWFPNLGITTTAWKSNDGGTPPIETIHESSVGTIATAHPSILMSSIHPILISNYIPGECFNPSVAMGRYVVPQMKFMMTNGLMKTFHTAAYRSVNGRDAAAVNSVSIDSLPVIKKQAGNLDFANFVGDLQDDGTSVKNLAFIWAKAFNQLERNMVIGNPIARFNHYNDQGKPIRVGTENLELQRDVADMTLQWSQQIADLQNYVTPTSWQPFCLAGTENSLNANANAGVAVSHYDVTAPKWRSDPAYDWEYKGQNWNPFHVPVPQYLPMSTCADKRVDKTIGVADFVNENQIFFGTHLPSSKAQVRRSFGALYPLNIPNQYQYGLYERLTYIVRDVQLETEQIILPRAAALSIVENALNGGITMETSTWKEMESILPRAKSQKHLINMAAAYCTSLSFLFRPNDTYQGDQAFGYDSFSFYNPFTSFAFQDTDASVTSPYNALGGIPVYNNVFVVSERIPIDLQLQLSSELLPRFPISTVSDLLLNSRWGDQVFSDRDYMELAPRIQPSYQVTKGQTINTLQDGFWACFVPIYALDDQSITCNPFFTPAEISLQKRLRGVRHSQGALPILKPFKGTFHISFNLEAYMGQSDRLRTGVPIVNNNMFLKFEFGHLLEAYHTQLLTIAVCDAKIVFERGGTMQFFT
jgi:hypothetical protein